MKLFIIIEISAYFAMVVSHPCTEAKDRDNYLETFMVQK